MTANKPSQKDTEQKVRINVWDIPTRAFHWLLVALVFYCWFSVEVLEDMQQHFWAGYGVLSLLLFRITWGFVGTNYAKFSSFVYSPKTILTYAKSIGQKDSRVYTGHNPVGGVFVLLLVIVLFAQASTGLFNSDDYFHGPLSGLVSDSVRDKFSQIHALNFELILVLVSIHIIAAFFYVMYKKQGLIVSMFTGKKTISKLNDRPITSSKLLLAIVILVLSVTCVYLIATGFTETLPSSEYDYSF